MTLFPVTDVVSSVFASLCSQPGALSRRDIHLYNHAVRAGDDELVCGFIVWIPVLV